MLVCLGPRVGKMKGHKMKGPCNALPLLLTSLALSLALSLCCTCQKPRFLNVPHEKYAENPVRVHFAHETKRNPASVQPLTLEHHSIATLNPGTPQHAAPTKHDAYLARGWLAIT